MPDERRPSQLAEVRAPVEDEMPVREADGGREHVTEQAVAVVRRDDRPGEEQEAEQRHQARAESPQSSDEVRAVVDAPVRACSRSSDAART